MSQDQIVFRPRKLTQEELEKSFRLYEKITSQTDVDYSRIDNKDRRLAGVQGEVWFNSELSRIFEGAYGGRFGYLWIAELKKVRDHVELPGDFLVDWFGYIEVKVAENENLCRIYCRRWNEHPALYVAILIKEKDESFRLLGFKHGYEIYESESEGDLRQPTSYYKVTNFRSPEAFLEKLTEIRNLHSTLNKPLEADQSEDS
jgi:hypothetical protein